jgi:hypothetical protein
MQPGIRIGRRKWKRLATISLVSGVAFSALWWALTALDVRLNSDFAFALSFPVFGWPSLFRPRTP